MSGPPLDAGSLDAFEEHIGPVAQVEPAWYGYLQGLAAGARPDAHEEASR